MTEEEFKNLRIGDVVKHIGGIQGTWVVTGNYDDHVTAVMNVEMTQADEWNLLARTDWKKK